MAFQSFDFEYTLFQKRVVRTKLDIYVLIVLIVINNNNICELILQWNDDKFYLLFLPPPLFFAQNISDIYIIVYFTLFFILVPCGIKINLYNPIF